MDAQHIRHPVRVILVHLATESLDMEFSRHAALGVRFGTVCLVG